MKSPGLDGYGAYLFKKDWQVVKTDMINGVQDYFINVRIYIAFNCTLVNIIPKSMKAKTIRDYRPISCCITIYKIISKVLTSKMSNMLESIIDKNQVAFVPC